MINNTDYVSTWKSKGLSAESIKPSTTSNNSLMLPKKEQNLPEVV